MRGTFPVLLFGISCILFVCISNVNGNSFDWDWMDCHNHGYYKGHFYPNNSDSPDICVCNEGWEGVECSFCKSDASCGKGLQCNRKFEVNKVKYLNCLPQDPAKLYGINGSISADFNFSDCYHGSGKLEVYNKGTGAPLMFNCSIEDCTKTIKSGDSNIYVDCSNINCHCTHWCGKFVAPIIDAFKGETSFTCDSRTGVCHIRNVPLLDVLLNCESSSCDEPHECIPPPPPKRLPKALQLFIKIGVPLVSFALFVVLVIALIFVKKRRDAVRKLLWQRMDHETHQATVAFANISCSVSFGRTKKEILQCVSGTAHPGQITAIMGASGGGKTTLIDILAGRKSVGYVTGDVLINGKKRGKSFKRISGYVIQDDLMMGTLTVREQITYAAMLRLPSLMPNEEKLDRVNKVMEELGITHIANSRIGTDMTRGISGGERKRVSIATELVTNPSILFLDEPTSGLDAYNASSLMETLKKLALEHKTTIIMSIHQPRSDIFHLFDMLMVLSGGRQVYFGPSVNTLEYFEGLGFKCPQNFNPADFIIDTVTMNPNLGHMGDDHRLFVASNNGYANNHNNGNANANGSQRHSNGSEKYTNGHHKVDYGVLGNVQYREEDEEKVQLLKDKRSKKYMNKEYSSSFWTQFIILSKRTLINILRNPYLLRAQYILTIALSLLIGFIFKDLSYDLTGIQGRAGCLFFLICLLSFSCMSSLDTFYNERSLFVRERAQGMYRTSSYFLSKTLCDILPMRVIPPFIMGTVTFWMVGHPQSNPEYEHYLKCVLVLILVSLVACTMCFAISSSCPSMGISNLLAILLFLFFMLFGGLLANKTTIPKYLSWFKWVSFMNYGYEILMVNELQGTRVLFNPPHVNPVYVTGEEFLEQFDMNPKRVWMDVGVLFGMAGGYLILSYLFLRFLIKERR